MIHQARPADKRASCSFVGFDNLAFRCQIACPEAGNRTNFKVADFSTCAHRTPHRPASSIADSVIHT